jgi:hypothetical protein
MAAPVRTEKNISPEGRERVLERPVRTEKFGTTSEDSKNIVAPPVRTEKYGGTSEDRKKYFARTE